jgi:NTE family protein
VDLIAPQCEKIIGVYVNPFEKLHIKDLKYSYSVLERAYRIKTAYDSIAKFKDCDILIYPKELKKIGTFSMKDIDAVFELSMKVQLLN